MSDPLPGPVPDDRDPNMVAERLVREVLVRQAMDALSVMTEMLEKGWNPVRAMRIIENYAASTGRNIRELVDEPIEGDLPMAGIYGDDDIIVPGAAFDPGNARLRRRQRRARGLGLVHGGEMEEMGEQIGVMLKTMGPMLKDLNGRGRTAEVRDLTGALLNARKIGDEALETRLRAKLDEMLSDESQDLPPLAPRPMNDGGDSVIDADFVDIKEVKP